MGRKLEDIRRLREKISEGKLSEKEADLERSVIKGRIVGTLLTDARNAAGRTPEKCAEYLGVTVDEYLEFEEGEASPTLPQLEVLAFLFNVPISQLWSGDTLAVIRQEKAVQERVPEIMLLRQRIIGVRLRQLREEAGIPVEQAAEETGISAELIEQTEAGLTSLTLSQLERLTLSFRASLDGLIDAHGPVGEWLQSRSDYDAFAQLPADMRSFILRPINRSYLELAMELSEMEVGKLRTIAESILDITL
ncbi:MAG: helix-turn-helix domain-containing protein [Anaerolineae bacterium]|nr:helix-turn-helix domain-containing protein [Anaerolineae bacterium]